MQLHDFETFIYLYETRSINLTAKITGYAQSNITARLKKIEEEYRLLLFQRTYQGLVPTEAGTEFYKYAKKVIDLTDDFLKTVTKTSKSQNIVMPKLLFDWLIVEHNDYDIVKGNITVLTSSQITEIEKPKYDTIITYASFSHEDYHQVGVGYLIADFYTNSLSKDIPIIVNSDHNCPFRIRTLKIIKNKKIIELASWDNIIELVKKGKGIALLPKYIGEREKLICLSDKREVRIPYKKYSRNQCSM